MGADLSMKGRSLRTLDDLADDELLGLLDLAGRLKRKKKAGIPGDLLRQKNIALVFEKLSTRTRCAATVAAVDEGAHAEFLDARDIHLGKKESVADSARVLGRMFDGILFRGYKQATVDLLAKYAGVPVWNGLTDKWHPAQTLADLMTVGENFGDMTRVTIVYVGDGRNNVVNSLMMGCAKVGVNFVNCTPVELSPGRGLVQRARRIAARHGSTITVSHDPRTGVKGANVVYTDVWVSMGEEHEAEERVEFLRPYRVDMDLMRRTGNVEDGRVIFLHCLPAIHDANTEYATEYRATEVADDVFEAPFSKVFDQAENRLHTFKALMVATLVGSGL